jgi:hypothetical protein
MIKLTSQGTVEERLRHLEHSVNYSEWIQAFPCADAQASVVVGAPVILGGIAVDRSIFRKLLPDARWLVYAAGFAAANDANTLSMSLVYQLDNTTLQQLGVVSTTTAGFIKLSMGPFDVFATGGVPAGETIPVIRLRGIKVAGANGSFVAWNIWLRLLANKQ